MKLFTSVFMWNTQNLALLEQLYTKPDSYFKIGCTFWEFKVMLKRKILERSAKKDMPPLVHLQTTYALLLATSC